MVVPPTANLGQPMAPTILPPSPSFITFFPPTSTTAGPATIAKNFFGTQPNLINWISHLDSRVFRDSKPKWHRVPKAAVKLNGRRRKTVMKLVTLPSARPYQRHIPSRPLDKHYNDKENEISLAKRVRATAEGTHGLTALVFHHTAAQSERLYWQAKAEVVNHIALHPDSVFDYTGHNLYLGGLKPVIRQKRRIDSTPASGSNLAFYRDLLELVVAAWEMNGLNTTKTDLVKHMMSLEGTRRDPREFLAALGATDLTAITDATEPDTTHGLMKPPSTPAAWTSSARRKARLSSYASAAARGKEANRVSPTKAQATATPAHEGETTGASLQTTPEYPADYAPNGPTRVFKVPSYTESSTTGDSEVGGDFGEAESSPVKRPEAPTPSRWDSAEPGTPGIRTPSQRDAARLATPGNKDPLGLLDAVPGSTTSSQPTPPSWKKWEKKASPATTDFQFSDATFEQTQASEQYSVFGSKNDRRRSEPLLQHLLKDRARRFSASPQKFFAGVDRFDETSAAGPSTPVRPQRNSLGDMESAKAGNESDFYTPLPSYFKTNFNPSQRARATPASRNEVYNIDMRQNLDIFGMQAPREEPELEDEPVKIKELADMAEEKCGGNAKVVVTNDMGKLIVRFKLPTRFAPMFPESQGIDLSHFTVTPSAISKSPRIGFNGHQFQTSTAPEDETMADKDVSGDPMSICQSGAADESLPAKGTSFEDSESSSLSELDHTPTVSGFKEMKAGSATPTPAGLPQKESLVASPHKESPTKAVSFALPSSARSEKTRVSSPIKTLNTSFAGNDPTLVVGDFDLTIQAEQPSEEPAMASTGLDSPADMSSLVETPTQQLQREAQEAPSSGMISDLAFDPTFQTPTFGHIDFSPSRVNNSTPIAAKQASATTPDAMPAKASPTKTRSPFKVTPKAMLGPTPTLSRSFTPVNKPSPHSKPATPTAVEHDAEEPEKAGNDAQQVAPEATHSRAAGVQYDDSPGRDYMYAFIRRAKPKRPTATETGSPVANSASRQPLGIKSPNTGSPVPQQGKRRLEEEVQEKESPTKPSEEPPSKKPRRPAKSVKKGEDEKKKKKGTAEAVKPAEKRAGSSQTVDPETDEPRRSTRIRNQPSEAEPLKSSIPTAIKLSRAGSGRGNQGLNSSVRNEQAELTRQTSMNTRKNRGKSESVQQVLARFSEELSGEDAGDEPQAEPKPSKRGKNVGWRDPIESFQQTPKAKRGKAAPKTKPTQGNTGVTKQKAAPKSRISQAAKNLGMASNGTPAKRMTRAQTRQHT